MAVQPALEPLRRWEPERIGPYVLLGRLGAGAMGQVLLGRSTAGRLVAVKTIKIEFAEEAWFRARFAREVAAARRVSGAFTAAVVAADADADVLGRGAGTERARGVRSRRAPRGACRPG